MKPNGWIWACAACAALCACGRSDPAPPPDLLKAQREQMDRAKATEKVLQDAANRRDSQLESQAK
jgi:hypothetical protein